jgi:hypothetical protein
MINGIDYKACKGCGEDCEIESFIRNNYEEAYCRECRVGCDVCGDWIGECGGCEPIRDETQDNMYTLGLEPRGAA